MNVDNFRPAEVYIKDLIYLLCNFTVVVFSRFIRTLDLGSHGTSHWCTAPFMVIQVYLIITLSLGSIEKYCVISETVL